MNSQSDKVKITMIIAAVLCFLAAAAGFLYLVGTHPDQAENYIRPMIPSLITVAASLALLIRSRAGHKETHEALNGQLDARITRIVRQLNAEQAQVIIEEVAPKDPENPARA